jgi:hypothetical protein
MRDPIIPAPPAIQAAAMEAVAMVEVATAVAAAAIRTVARNGCVVVPVPQLLLDSF